MKAAKALAKWTFDRMGDKSFDKPDPYLSGSARWTAYREELIRLMQG